MRNFFDNLAGREWMVWCRQLSSIGDDIVKCVTQPADFAQQGITEEQQLSGFLTDIVQRWASLRSQQNKLASAFNEQGLVELKGEATRRRIESMGVVSRVRSTNFRYPHYQPLYNTFTEMADIQVSLWESLIHIAEAVEIGLANRSASDFSTLVDPITQYLQFSESLGEEALSRLPELSQRKAEAEKRSQQRALWGCLAFTVAAVAVAVIVLVLML